GADHGGLLLDRPARHFDADPRRPLVFADEETRIVVFLGIGPVHAPAVVEENRVARLDGALVHSLPRQRTPNVGERHFVAAVEDHPAFIAGDVDQDPTGDDRLHVLDAERLEAADTAVLSGEILLREPVVI